MNVAVAARRAGIEAAYLGAIGTDGAGLTIKAALSDEGVSTDRLRVVAGSNAYSIVEIEDGDRLFVGSDVGVSRFTLDGGDLSYLAQFECVHSGSRSGTEGQIEDLARSARVCFDFSDRPRTYYEPLLDKVWMACFSGARLDPAGVGELTKRALRTGPEIVLVTEGPRGASITTASGETVRVEANPITPLDTLGAGDAVIGTVLAGVLRGDDLQAVMSSAMSVAAKVCVRFGAFGQGREFPGPGEQVPGRGHRHETGEED